MTSTLPPDEMYLIAYGATGTLGCFVAEDHQVNYPRGSSVMVRTERGRELGTVLSRSGSLGLPDEIKLTPGVILGLPSDVREHEADAQVHFVEARQLAGELHLPLEIIDIELLSEPATAVLHVVYFGQIDASALQTELATRWQRRVLLHDMTNPEALEEAVEQGCQSCGSGGGCSDCGSGGCSTGGCSSSASSTRQFQHDWKSYFAELRVGMERSHHTPHDAG